MDELEVLFNSFAQSIITFDECVDNIKLLSYENYEILKKIGFLVIQAHPNVDIIEETIQNCPIKITMTPSVILKSICSKKYSLQTGIYKIIDLPANEYLKSFTVLLHLFKNADTKRRLHFCSVGCSHDWHNYDYLKDSLIQSIKNK